MDDHRAQAYRIRLTDRLVHFSSLSMARRSHRPVVWAAAISIAMVAFDVKMDLS